MGAVWHVNPAGRGGQGFASMMRTRPLLFVRLAGTPPDVVTENGARSLNTMDAGVPLYAATRKVILNKGVPSVTVLVGPIAVQLADNEPVATFVRLTFADVKLGTSVEKSLTF